MSRNKPSNKRSERAKPAIEDVTKIAGGHLTISDVQRVLGDQRKSVGIPTSSRLDAAAAIFQYK